MQGVINKGMKMDEKNKKEDKYETAVKVGKDGSLQSAL